MQSILRKIIIADNQSQLPLQWRSISHKSLDQIFHPLLDGNDALRIPIGQHQLEEMMLLWRGEVT